MKDSDTTDTLKRVSIPFISGQCVILKVKIQVNFLEFVSIPFISGQCVIMKDIKVPITAICFNPLYIGSMCNLAILLEKQM